MTIVGARGIELWYDPGFASLELAGTRPVIGNVERAELGRVSTQ